ncbi:acid protease [Mycena floridula]|nr:acid protease [Mycena floridula]
MVSSSGFKVSLIRVPTLQNLDRFHAQVLAEIPLSNDQEFLYLVSVQVGNQPFLCILDTGSADFWVVSSNCVVSDCDSVSKYATSPSLSISTDGFNIKYLLGSVEGMVVSDTVTLGSFEISGQILGLANKTQGLSLASSGSSGVLGLAFPSEASITGTTTLDTIFRSLDECCRFFALKLGRYSRTDDPPSSLTFGYLDDSLALDFSTFFFTAVSQAGSNTFDYWKIPLIRLTINSTDFTLSPSRTPGSPKGCTVAVLDSGTTLVLGPTSDVDKFYLSVGGSRKNPDTGSWELSCSRALVVGFVLGEAGREEKEFILDPADISWAEGDTLEKRSWCMGGIQSNDNAHSADWILGATFLRNVYVSHHGANSTHPPMIGLREMTDVSSALERFRSARGVDPASWTPIHVATVVSRTSLPRFAQVCTISSLCGFLAGVTLTLIFFVHRRISDNKRKCRTR